MTLKKTQSWKYFSLYIRIRDKGICYTCLKKDDPKNMDAGHYFHRSAKMFFSPIFVRAQCTGCNRFKHGNLGIYARRLTEEIGIEKLKEAEIESTKLKRWSPRELKLIQIQYMRELYLSEKKEKLKKFCIHDGKKFVQEFCGVHMPRKKKTKSPIVDSESGK